MPTREMPAESYVRRSFDRGCNVACNFSPCGARAVGDMVPAREWRRSPWMNEHVRPARLAHFLGSHRVMTDGTVEGMGYMRAAGDRAFDDGSRTARCPAVVAGVLSGSIVDYQRRRAG